MKTNTKNVEEKIEPEKTHNIYAVSIPKTNLKIPTNTRDNDTPQNSQNTRARNDISQYDKIKERIKNINFKTIVTEIKEKGESFQDKEIDHVQYPNQQNKLLEQYPHNGEIQTEYLNPNKIIDKLNTTKNSNNITKEDIIRKQDNICKVSPQKYKKQFAFTGSSQVSKDNTDIESKIMNDSDNETDILILQSNGNNHETSPQKSDTKTDILSTDFRTSNKRESRPNNKQVERKDAHGESRPHLHCLPTGLHAHSAIRSARGAHTIPERYTETNQDNPINSLENITCRSYKVNPTNINQNDYEELNPIKKPKKQNLENEDNIQKDWEELEEIQSQQKLLLREIQQAKIEMAIKSKRYIPYHNTPLYMASYAIKSNKPTFCCKACGYNTESKSHFDNHHRSKNHHESLARWNIKQEKNKDMTKENNTENSHNTSYSLQDEEYYLEYYTSKTHKRYPNKTNIMNNTFKQDTNNALRQKEINTSNDQAPIIIENLSDEDIIHQQTLENKEDQISKPTNTQNKDRIIKDSNEENIDDHLIEDLTPMEIVETTKIQHMDHYSIQSQKEQNRHQTRDTIIDKKDNPDTLTEQNIKELSNSCNYEIAIRKIHQRVPIQYRHNLIALLSTIYQSGTDYEIQIEIRDNFQDKGHWILSKYHKLLKNRNTRQHLQTKLKRKEYDLVSKSRDQEEEIKHIAGSARIIYDILVHCQFVPIEYLGILATLLNKREDHQYTYSSILLPEVYSTYGEIIDLMLNTGAFYISTKEINKEPTSIIINENNNTKGTTTYTNTNNTKNHTDHSYQRPAEDNIITNEFKELQNRQAQLKKEDLIMQITLQKSFDTLQDNNEKDEWNSIISQEQTRRHWSLHEISEEQDSTYNQNNPDSPLPMEFNSKQEDNTVYVEGIQGSRIKEIKEMFELNGSIKRIFRLTASTAIIRFYNPQSAKAAISNFDGILHRNITLTVVSCPSKFKEVDDNQVIYVRGIIGSSIGQIKNLFTLNGPIKRILRLTANTAIIKFHEQQAAINAIKNFNFTIHNNNTIFVQPAKRKKEQAIIKNEIEGELVIDEDNIDDYSTNNKNPENEIIEAEIKQELLDIQESFSSKSFENSNASTTIYAIPSLPSSPISWPISDTQSEDNNDKSHFKSDKTEHPYLNKELQNSIDKSIITTEPEEQYPPSKVAISYQTEGEILPHSPTPSEPFHGFESITSCSPDTIPKIPFDQRLEAYRNNAWELMVMEDIEIPPKMLVNLPIKITAENNPHIRPLRSQSIFVIIAALYPYPQINDGIYHTKNRMDWVAIKNSSKDKLLFKKGGIIEGVKAHTHNFVVHSLLNNYDSTCSIHMNKLENWTKWHHEAKLFQKILAYHKGFGIQQEKALEYYNT